MKTLKDQIKFLQDLRKRHKVACLRYYTRDSQAILLELITREIRDWPDETGIPEDLYLTLLNQEPFFTSDIEELCLLYRQVVRLKSRIDKEISTES